MSTRQQIGFGQKRLRPLACNTLGVTMARAHLCSNDCDHMWKKLKEKSIRTLETRV
jgi:hypothetical protein